MTAFTAQLSQKLVAAGCQSPEQAARNVERLAPDAAAQSQLETILPALLTGLRRVPDPDLALNEYPKANKGWGARVDTLQDSVVGWARKRLLVLFGAVCFVLPRNILAACLPAAFRKTGKFPRSHPRLPPAF